MNKLFSISIIFLGVLNQVGCSAFGELQVTVIDDVIDQLKLTH